MFDQTLSPLLCTRLPSLPRGRPRAARQPPGPAPLRAAGWRQLLTMAPAEEFQRGGEGDLRPAALGALAFLRSFAPSLRSRPPSAGCLCPWSALPFPVPGGSAWSLCLSPEQGLLPAAPPRWAESFLQTCPVRMPCLRHHCFAGSSALRSPDPGINTSS